MVFDPSGYFGLAVVVNTPDTAVPCVFPLVDPDGGFFMTVECVSSHNKVSVLPRSSHSLDTEALLYRGLSLLFSFKP
jgi:hypothetical protein